MADIEEITIKGDLQDEQGRCRHYHSVKDVIAIKMKCCGSYYACIECHTEQVNHAALVWPAREFGTRAVLCGVCRHEMTITEYLQSNNECPACNAAFNPGCSNHYHFYFEMKAESL